MIIAEWCELWLQTYIEPKRAISTVTGYRYALAHLPEQVAGMELEAADPLTLQRAVNQLAAQYERQAQILHVALHEAFGRAYRLGMVSRNPMDLVDKPTHESAEAEILTAAEAQAYARAAADQPAGALLLLMLCMGLRRNEARGLRCGDLGEDGILRIRQQRTRNGMGPLKSRSSKRDIPCPEPLRRFFAGEPGAFVCDVSERALRAQHLAVLAAIGVDRRVTLHGLRHTAATLALAGGAHLVAVQKMLGHKHFGLTADIYAHREIAMVGRCVESVLGAVSA